MHDLLFLWHLSSETASSLGTSSESENPLDLQRGAAAIPPWIGEPAEQYMMHNILNEPVNRYSSTDLQRRIQVQDPWSSVPAEQRGSRYRPLISPLRRLNLNLNMEPVLQVSYLS